LQGKEHDQEQHHDGRGKQHQRTDNPLQSVPEALVTAAPRLLELSLHDRNHLLSFSRVGILCGGSFIVARDRVWVRAVSGLSPTRSTAQGDTCPETAVRSHWVFCDGSTTPTPGVVEHDGAGTGSVSKVETVVSESVARNALSCAFSHSAWPGSTTVAHCWSGRLAVQCFFYTILVCDNKRKNARC